LRDDEPLLLIIRLIRIVIVVVDDDVILGVELVFRTTERALNNRRPNIVARKKKGTRKK
jgi:hypothetical protein